jgi:3-dehydroquinate synthase
MQLTKASLLIKKSIVEYDEFELDIRRSMNYGHSVGHALEALSNYYVPHGTAVAFGILVENQISHNRQLLEHSQLTQMFQLGRSLIPDQTWQLIQDLDPNKLLPYLSNDKKAEGNILKIASLVRLGDMKFLDLPLDSLGLAELVTAFGQVIDQ